MVESLQAKNFQGMNNVLDKSPLDQPTILLNAHNTLDGKLKKRPGIGMITALPGSHSLWTDNNGLILCMAKGSLYKLIDQVPILITSTGQSDSPVHYVLVSGRVYMSNAFWTGVYNIKTNEIESWGCKIPETPILTPCEGSLPAGTYNVTLTVLDSTGRLSGNSNIATITLTDSSGIKILNPPDNFKAWITNFEGSIFYYAGSYENITELLDSPEPLPTLWGSPPIPMSHITWAFGRMWGFNNTKLYYSEPYQPELFTLNSGWFECDSLGGFIAKTSQGLFLGLKDRTIFLRGREPSEMIEITDVGPGVVPGSLCYANELGQLGTNVPIWIAKDGVYAGTSDGQSINIIKNKIQMTAEQSQAASIYRVVDGHNRMLFSYKQGSASMDMSMGDDASCEVVRKGTVI